MKKLKVYKLWEGEEPGDVEEATYGPATGRGKWNFSLNPPGGRVQAKKKSEGLLGTQEHM